MGSGVVQENILKLANKLIGKEHLSEKNDNKIFLPVEKMNYILKSSLEDNFFIYL